MSYSGAKIQSMVTVTFKICIDQCKRNTGTHVFQTQTVNTGKMG